MHDIKLPNKILLTGAPGSKWSSVASALENIDGFNTTGHSEDRKFYHSLNGGHSGAYFGTGMEFPPDPYCIEDAFADPTAGTMIAKSHEWMYNLDQTLQYCHETNSWLLMIYSSDLVCFNWWKDVGGFNIPYPNYDWYENDDKMLEEIHKQNEFIMKFTNEHNLEWSHLNHEWFLRTFGKTLPGPVNPIWYNVIAAVYKT
jgi:hypothetical protein